MRQRLINLDQIMRDHEMPHLKDAISSGRAVELDMPHCVKYEAEDGLVYQLDPPIIHFYPLEEGYTGFQIAYISRENGEADVLTFHAADILGNAYVYDSDGDGAPLREKAKIHLEKELPIMPLPEGFEYNEPEWPDIEMKEDNEPPGPVLH